MIIKGKKEVDHLPERKKFNLLKNKIEKINLKMIK